ncbi:Gfo/Idh/MocA family oxidoreductase [Glutamicibacter sp. V16R2B1]|uniref:Gfo/Idh/MocA family protein n=1 Tax=Glutamicibacter sp. V16R2B1 TaxID=2036207 RepID=UPI0010FD6213|nr:Gfo/Idh/MocA family oxidoreductase [Glutamicibacter sp. V16R2B1]TLK56540.1 Gfo/Idh/MocA family oxidoreductase [Glutamicibacter sp. V16R2B1]
MSYENKSLRVGIVGCGNISNNHARAYAGIEGVRVVGVCDVDLARAKTSARQWQVPHAVQSVQQLLELDLDIVSVCTPHPTHEQVVLQAAAAGVHVLCEKPIAVDVSSAERMIHACDVARVKLGVLFQRRFWPAAQKLRELVDDGTLGTPVLGQASVLLHREPEYYSADAWRGTWNTDGGGVLMTQAIHYLDLLQWYMGPVAEVYGSINTFKHSENIEVEDSASVLLKFTSGAMATLNASTAANPSLGVQIRLMGNTGVTAELSEFPEGSDGRLTLLAQGEQISVDEVYSPQTAPNVQLSMINQGLMPHHRAQIEQFVHAVRADKEPLVSGADASNALRILLAVYSSARTGVPVRFAEFPHTAPMASDEVVARLGNPALA